MFVAQSRRLDIQVGAYFGCLDAQQFEYPHGNFQPSLQFCKNDNTYIKIWGGHFFPLFIYALPLISYDLFHLQ